MELNRPEWLGIKSVNWIRTKSLVTAHVVRNHWAVENSIHWVLDVSFREDESRIRKDNAPDNFLALRYIALNKIKREASRFDCGCFCCWLVRSDVVYSSLESALFQRHRQSALLPRNLRLGVKYADAIVGQPSHDQLYDSAERFDRTVVHAAQGALTCRQWPGYRAHPVCIEGEAQCW